MSTQCPYCHRPIVLTVPPPAQTVDDLPHRTQRERLLDHLEAVHELTTRDAARFLYGTQHPSMTQQERARVLLNELTAGGLLRKLPGSTRTAAAIYVLQIDPLELLAITGVQTARSLAVALSGSEKPSRADIERARRKLERMVVEGKATRRPPRDTQPPDAWQYVPAQDPQELDLAGVMAHAST
jgi:hypothetical protein